MVAAGSYGKRLLENCALIFESKSKDEHGDYHKDMDSGIFEKWIRETVVPALTKKSCLVMDNASYHTVINPEDKVPTMSSAKTKRDLLQLINNSEKSKATIFPISHILEDSLLTTLS